MLQYFEAAMSECSLQAFTIIPAISFSQRSCTSQPKQTAGMTFKKLTNAYCTHDKSLLRRQPVAQMGHVHKGNSSCCAVSHCSTTEALLKHCSKQHTLNLLQQAVVLAPTSPVQVGLHHSQAKSESMLHHREEGQVTSDGIGEPA